MSSRDETIGVRSREDESAAERFVVSDVKLERGESVRGQSMKIVRREKT